MEPILDFSTLKEIPSFREGKKYAGYYINEMGDVFSTHYRKGHGVKKLTPHKSKNGYLQVNINGSLEYVHRLVAVTYIPNPQNKREVNHKDLNKEKCEVSNLEWVTPSENVLHAKKNCRRKTKTSSNSGILYQNKKKLGHFDSLQQAKKYCKQHFNCSLCTIKTCNANRRNNLVFVRDSEENFDINEYWDKREKIILWNKTAQDIRNKKQKGMSGTLYKNDTPIGSFPSIREAEKYTHTSLKKKETGTYSSKGYCFLTDKNALICKM